MTKSFSWDDVKWRSSIRVLTSIFKYHCLLMFLVTALNVILFNVFRFLITSSRSPIINFSNVFLNLLPSFFFLFLLFCFRHASFKGCFIRSFYLEFFSFASTFLVVLTVLFTANSFMKLNVTEFRFSFVLVGCLLHSLRVKRQNMDVCRVLDTQNVINVKLHSYFVKSFIHSVLSYILTMALYGFMHLVYLVGHSSFPWLESLKYKNLLTSLVYDVNYFISQLPCTTNYYHFSFGFFEKFELFLALIWILSLCDYYFDMMNMESTHMDIFLMNSVDEMPVHNLSNIQDEMLFARAAYNYSKGVSYTLNSSSMRYMSNPPSLKMPDDETVNAYRSYIQPFKKLSAAAPFQHTSGNNYIVDSKKDRYQLDSVVYKMLVDKTKNFWSNYVQSCLEIMDESRLNLHHLIDYPFTKDQKINIMDRSIHTYKHQPNMGFYTALQSFLLHVASYFNCFYTSKALSTNVIYTSN